MTDRDRLIELLNGSRKKYLNLLDFEKNLIADHLLANGVIVPPCKVGDKVYRIAKDGKTITEEQISQVNLEFTIDNGTGIKDVWWLKDYNIGVTTFLTKEEAEEKLKELNDNDR